MPQVANFRHERFAWFRSEGLLLEDAYERAGYVPGLGHASRLAAREDVRERIVELRLNHTDVLTADHARIIDKLMRLSAEARTMAPEAAEQARRAMLEAARLQAELAEARFRDRERFVRGLDGDARANEALAQNSEAKTSGPAPVQTAIHAV